MRFPHFLFLEKISPKDYKKISGRFLFHRYIFRAAYAASTGLEIPAVHFRLHGFTAEAGTPVVDSIGFHSFECMDMGIGRTQNIAAIDAVMIFPILYTRTDRVGNDVRNSCTGSASSPVAGFICMIDILMIGGTGTTVTAAVTDLITVGSVDMLVHIRFLFTSGADFPML